MSQWLDKLVKILALGLDTQIAPERRAAIVVAADLAARHRMSLASAYSRIERMKPEAFRYLEAKRTTAGLAGFVAEADMGVKPCDAGAWDGDLAHYAGDRRALAAMLSCTVRPPSRRVA